MENNNLVFIPTGLNSPEYEVLISTAQNLLDKNQKVTLLVCRGGDKYSCSKNILVYYKKKNFLLIKVLILKIIVKIKLTYLVIKKLLLICARLIMSIYQSHRNYMTFI